MKNQSFSNQPKVAFLLEFKREGQDQGCLWNIFTRSLSRTSSRLSLSQYQRLLSLSQYQRLLSLPQCQFYTFKKLAPVVCLSSKEKIRIKVAFETLSHKCRRDSHFQCNLFRSWRKWKRDNLRTEWSSWQSIAIPRSNSSTAILRISPQTNSSVSSPGKHHFTRLHPKDVTGRHIWAQIQLWPTFKFANSYSQFISQHLNLHT